MTGYGRGEAALAGGTCVVECHSVNRRGLEVSVQLPRQAMAIDKNVRDAVAARVERGRVEVSITTEGAGSRRGIIDPDVAEAALGEILQLRARLGLAGAPTIRDVLAVPGVVAERENRAMDLSATDWPIVSDALARALSRMVAMRELEGRNLAKELSAHSRGLRKAAAQIGRLAPKVVRKHREVLISRLREAGLGEGVVSDSRVAQEVAFFAERCDISEEIARLGSHLDQFQEQIASGGAVGRSLEFLAQEMLREFNTIGSKAGDAAISRIAVDSKVVVDKIREQALNVE